MAWSVMLGSAHNVHLPKDEHLIAPVLSHGSQDLVRGALKRQRQSMASRQDEADEDDLTDELGNPAEKKRRLTVEQVKFLETSFNKDLKLDPERKAQIAKQLGLRPRQVAIWFQNRRARWKNKQLEQDFENLKAKFEAAVEENDNIMKEKEAVLLENKKLLAEVDRLKSLLQVHEHRGVCKALEGGVTMGKPVLSLDIESGFKEEQLSGKSDLTSPTKSTDDQSEVQDSGRSYVASSEEAAMCIPELPPFAELHSAATCLTTVKPELEYQHAVALSDELFGNVFNPLVFQQLAANGVFFEDACNYLFSWEDQLHGNTWRG